MMFVAALLAVHQPACALAQPFVVGDTAAPHRFDLGTVTGNGNQTSTSLAGGSARYVNVQDDLLTTNNQVPGERISKEMWVGFDSAGYTWIESGDIAPVDDSGTAYRGHFWAESTCPDPSCYSEFVTGNQNPTGYHDFEISYSAQNGDWEVYIDNVFVTGVYDFPSKTSNYDVQLGVEDTNNYFSFVSGTYYDYVQYRDVSGIWHDWSEAGTVQTFQQAAPTNWAASFSPTVGENVLSLYD